MSVGELDARSLDEAGAGLPVLRLLQTFWGLAAILCLGVYSLVQVLEDGATARAVPPRSPPIAAATGNARPFASTVVHEPMVVHLACNQEDARWARIYDPPASGPSVILRIDQSADLMRTLYTGGPTQFPHNTRLITTPCTQAMIDNGEFP